MGFKEVDYYPLSKGRGKPIMPEEIEECAEKFAVGDCVSIKSNNGETLVGKITAKTKRFLQVTPTTRGRVPRTFPYSDIIVMGNKIQKISEQEMVQLAKDFT